MNRTILGRRKREKPRAFIILVGLLAVFVLVGCNNGATQSLDSLPTPTPLPTPIVPEKPIYTVEQGVVVNQLVFNGRVSPVIEEPLSFGRQGTIKNVYITRGDTVQAGDVLAELDLSEIETEIREAEISLEKAIFDLEKAKADHAESLLKAEIELRKEELNAAKTAAEQSSISELTSKQIELQNAQSAVGSAATAYQEALVNNDYPQDAVDSLARALEQANQQLLIAEASYNDTLRKDGVKVIDAQISELDQILKQMEYEKLLAGIEPSFEQAVEKAQLDLAEAQEKLTNAQLVAPFSGQIMSVSIKKGEQAEPLKTVIIIADLNSLEITANIDATDLEKLSVGSVAAVQIRNRPDATLDGVVRQLPYPYGGGSSVDSNNEDKSVRITVEDTSELELGELAEITVVLEEKSGVLWLPPAAIRRFQGRQFVVVQQGDGQQRVDVQIGITSESRVEILDGVEAGQIIVGE